MTTPAKLGSALAAILIALAPAIVSIVEARDAKRIATSTESRAKVETVQADEWQRDQWAAQVRELATMAGHVEALKLRVEALEARSNALAARQRPARSRATVEAADALSDEAQIVAVDDAATRYLQRVEMPPKPAASSPRVLDALNAAKGDTP